MAVLKTLVQQSFYNSKATYAKHATQQKYMQEVLQKMLAKALQSKDSRNLGDVLELGAGNGDLCRFLTKEYDFTRYIALDLADFSSAYATEQNIAFVQADFEALDAINLGGRFDIIVSNAALQWGNQQVVLPKVSALLKQGGILLFSTFGKENFKEMRLLFGIGLDYLELSAYPLLLHDCMLLESFREEKVLQFSRALEVFRHCKHTGVNALQEHFLLKKAHLRAYATRFNNKLTYEMLFLCAQKL